MTIEISHQKSVQLLRIFYLMFTTHPQMKMILDMHLVKDDGVRLICEVLMVVP